MSAYNLEQTVNKIAHGWNITDKVLTGRQIKAGLQVLEDEDWVTLTTKGGTVIDVFGIHTPKESVQDSAEKYLDRIDWHE
jgi:hypothetical protein